MRKRVLCMALSLVMFAVALCGCAGDKQGNNPSEIIIGIPQDIEETLDPHEMLAAGTKEIFFNVFEGLVKPDNDGNIVPALASDIQVSEDMLTYTFTLREGVKFHDGTNLTAEDVVYSVKKFADIEGGNPKVAAFINVKEVNKVSDTQVEIVLASADPDFLNSLASVEAAIIPAGNTNPAGTAVGTGPYCYKSRVPLDNVVFVKNPEYWGECGNIEQVTFKICANSDTVPMELNSGTIDMYARLTDAQVSQISNSDVEILEGTMNLVQALYLNNDYEPLSDERVRKAVCYALDRQAVLDYVSDGKGTIIGSAMYPAYKKYYDETIVNNYSNDVEKAKDLLKEAGYENGFDLEITVPSNYSQHMDTALVISNQLKEIGINATINPVDWETWLSDTYVGRKYQATVIGVDAAQLTASALLSRYVSTADNNFVNFTSNAYDEAYAKAQSSGDDNERTKCYKECISILSTEAASAYIQDLPMFVAVNNRFDGYEFYPMYIMDVSKMSVKVN